MYRETQKRIFGSLSLAFVPLGLLVWFLTQDVARAIALPSGRVADANGDGRSDLKNILDRIAELERDKIVFDEDDSQGHVPARRRDGAYHMCCVDLILVAYRAAGYDIAAAMCGGKLIGGDFRRCRGGVGRCRKVALVSDYAKREPLFHYYEGPDANLSSVRWTPKVRFRVGDMVFIRCRDNGDRHSGIVTGVDPKTGLPSYITQISFYSRNRSLHRSTLDEFFGVSCRQLTGYARPALWDSTPVTQEEQQLIVTAPPRPPFYGGACGAGALADSCAEARRRLARGRAEAAVVRVHR